MCVCVVDGEGVLFMIGYDNGCGIMISLAAIRAQ